MIDIEAELFSMIYESVSSEFPTLYMTGEYVSQPSSFPCVSLVEIDNSTLNSTLTDSGHENHITVTYELNVYSNRSQGRKTECRKIASFVDDIMMELNFTRTMLEPVPNLQDSSIYRMTGRYRAVVGKDHTLYRR